MTSLSDLVGASGLSLYAIVAMLLFIAAFLLILIPIVAPGRRAHYEQAARLPLDDVRPQSPRAS